MAGSACRPASATSCSRHMSTACTGCITSQPTEDRPKRTRIVIDKMCQIYYTPRLAVAEERRGQLKGQTWHGGWEAEGLHTALAPFSFTDIASFVVKGFALFVTEEEAAEMYARACHSWYGARAKSVVRAKIRALKAKGDVNG